MYAPLAWFQLNAPNNVKLHIFPKFWLDFSNPGYKHIPDVTFYSSVLTISYMRQWTSFPVSGLVRSENMYQLADVWLQVIHAHVMWLHCGLASMSRYLSGSSWNALRHLWARRILLRQLSECLLSLPCLTSVPQDGHWSTGATAFS